MFIATGIASCKKETAIPEDNREALRNAQSALSQDKSDYYLKNWPAKNVVFIPLNRKLNIQFPTIHLPLNNLNDENS